MQATGRDEARVIARLEHGDDDALCVSITAENPFHHTIVELGAIEAYRLGTALVKFAEALEYQA